MKKLMSVLALVGLMVLTLSCSAFAANQLYFDYIIDGEVEDADLSGFILGGEYQIDSFKVGLEYLTGDVKISGYKIDCTQTNIKGGYEVAENFYVTLSLLDGEIEKAYDYDGILLGGELSYDIAENMVFEGALAISIDGEVKAEGQSADVDYTIFKLKFTYLFAENIGASFGYNNMEIEGDGESIDINYMTLGVTYKF